MPRNASGTYSLPAGNPVVTLTTITSSWANTTLDDLKVEVTDSLSRSGKGAMLAALALVDGAVSAPALAFATELATGLYRAAAGDLRLAVGGADRARFGPTTSVPAVTLTSPQAAAGTVDDFTLAVTTTPTGARNFLNVLSGGATVLRLAAPGGRLVLTGTDPAVQVQTVNTTLTLVGNRAAADAAGADVVAVSIATRTAGFLFAVQNNGASRAAFDFNGALYLNGPSPVILSSPVNSSLTLRGNRSAADAGADAVLNGQATRTAGNLLVVQNNGVEALRLDFNANLGLGGGLASGSTVAVSAAGTNGALQLTGNRAAADAGADVIIASTATRTAGNLLNVSNGGALVAFVSAAVPEVVAFNTWHRGLVSADFSTTSNVLQNIPGLSFSATASADYEFTAVIEATRASAATNLDIAFSGPAAPTAFLFSVEAVVSGSLTPIAVSSFGTAAGFLSGTNNLTYVFFVRAVLRNGINAGTVQMQVRSSDNTTNVTIAKGSTMDWRRLDALA